MSLKQGVSRMLETTKQTTDIYSVFVFNALQRYSIFYLIYE